MPTYKVVLEIESDCDLDGLNTALSHMLNPPFEEQEEGKRLSGVVLAAAETQSSRARKPGNR